MTQIETVEKQERSAKLESILDELMLKIMINLNERGYGTAEILVALDRVCEKRHQDYDEDPDPSDDP